jgi:hypothetical protein
MRPPFDNMGKVNTKAKVAARSMLPRDYSRCSNGSCELCTKCARFLDIPKVGIYTCSSFPGGIDCEYFIDSSPEEK